MGGLNGIVPAGVVTGDNLIKLFEYCKKNGHAIPAFNCTSTSTINAVLQAARDINSPVIIQFSNGGAAFLAGKGIKKHWRKGKPNKKFYDPRVWIRAAEESMIKRAHESFKCLNGANVCGDDWPKSS